MSGLWQLLGDVVPSDTCAQSCITMFATEVARERTYKQILDLGCGLGSSYDLFRRLMPCAHWVGVDIPDSVEALARSRDLDVVYFDGVNIPLGTETVDFIYSSQVFEHVRHPEPLLREMRRVLQPSGTVAMSISSLQPYHSRSYWNFTPWGFRRIAEDAGFKVRKMRPGIDAITLIERQLAGNDPAFNRFFSEESPLNKKIEQDLRAKGANNKIINLRKLEFCGVFLCELGR